MKEYLRNAYLDVYMLKNAGKKIENKIPSIGEVPPFELILYQNFFLLIFSSIQLKNFILDSFYV